MTRKKIAKNEQPDYTVQYARSTETYHTRETKKPNRNMWIYKIICPKYPKAHKEVGYCTVHGILRGSENSKEK